MKNFVLAAILGIFSAQAAATVTFRCTDNELVQLRSTSEGLEWHVSENNGTDWGPVYSAHPISPWNSQEQEKIYQGTAATITLMNNEKITFRDSPASAVYAQCTKIALPVTTS